MQPELGKPLPLTANLDAIVPPLEAQVTAVKCPLKVSCVLAKYENM